MSSPTVTPGLRASTRAWLQVLYEARRGVCCASWLQTPWLAACRAFTALAVCRLSEPNPAARRILANILRMRVAPRNPAPRLAARDPKRYREYYPNGPKAQRKRRGAEQAFRIAILRQQEHSHASQP